MTNSNIGLLPVTDGGVTVGYVGAHRAVDIGYYKAIYADVMAWNDGKVVKCWTTKNGGDQGESVLLEHTFDDKPGYKRWSLYMHALPGSTAVKVGQKVVMGQKLFRRGNSGYSHGPHLHFALSELVPISYAYSYSRFYAKCTFRPLDLCYIDDKHNWENYIDPVQEWPKDLLSVGDSVKIIAPGNSRSDGKGTTLSKAVIGWKRQVLAIIEGAPFPYKVGSGNIATGYFTKEQLEKL